MKISSSIKRCVKAECIRGVMSGIDIAEEYGVSRAVVSMINKNKLPMTRKPQVRVTKREVKFVQKNSAGLDLVQLMYATNLSLSSVNKIIRGDYNHTLIK